MSYLFDGSNHILTGTFTSSYSDAGLTLACYIKWTAGEHPLGARTWFQLGNSSSAHADSLYIGCLATDDTFVAGAFDSVPTVSNNSLVKDISTGWGAAVATFGGSSLRRFYFSDQDSGDDTRTRSVADALKYILVGRRLDGTIQLTNGYLAELAIWNVTLSAAEISSYLSGTAASSIAATNLIGYWPLDYDDPTQSNEGTDTGGDLTVTNATYSSEHPTITAAVATITPNPAGLGAC